MSLNSLGVSKVRVSLCFHLTPGVPSIAHLSLLFVVYSLRYSETDYCLPLSSSIIYYLVIVELFMAIVLVFPTSITTWRYNECASWPRSTLWTRLCQYLVFTTAKYNLQYSDNARLTIYQHSWISHESAICFVISRILSYYFTRCLLCCLICFNMTHGIRSLWVQNGF